MNEPTDLRPSRSRPASPRAGICLSIAAAVLGLALSSAWLGPASAQQPPAGVPGAGVEAPGKEKEKAEEAPTPAERLIDAARDRLAKLDSCAADLEQRVDMLNRHVIIKGRYLKAPENRLYFRLRVVDGLPDASGTTLQICDGETRWEYQAVLDQQFYNKYSIKPVMERLNSPELDPRMKEQIKEGMGFAGPESLLVGIRKFFRFDQDPEQGKLGEKTVWILRGSWRREVRQGLTGPDQRQVAVNGLLPPYMPMDAILYLGKDDYWPYKLELKGRPTTELYDTRKEGVDGRKIGSRSSIEKLDPTDITLEYTNVKINPALKLDEFVFQAPPQASVEDMTEMIIKQLDSAIAMAAERKKAEAAKKEGPILDKPLEVPEAPGAPSSGPPPQQ